MATAPAPPPPPAPPTTGIRARFERVLSGSPWTNVYGLARTIIAVATLLTLLTTPSDALWSPFHEGRTGPLGCEGLRGAVGFFCIFPPEHLDIAHRTAILVLALVATGWRPRVTGILHWWISFSFLATATRDGGDQVAALVTLFLIPWTLTDPREWHWQSPPAVRSEKAVFLAHTARVLIRVQVMVVYLHSAVTKFPIEQWTDGTAVYYWFHDPIVGASPGLEPLLYGVARSPLIMALTWGAIVGELLLVAGLVAPRRLWTPLRWLGFAFHLGIMVGLGISSFALAMIGALIIYLRPPEKEYRWLRRRAA